MYELQVSCEEVPHPFDVNYESLKADLVHLEKTCDEFAVLEKYLKATEPQWRKVEILDVWKMDREGAVSMSSLAYCATIDRRDRDWKQCISTIRVFLRF